VNDVEELKRFVLVHARAQNLDPATYQRVLNGIEHDRDGGPGSWTAAWSAEAAARADDPLAAARFYTMARFPFVDGDARATALRKAVEEFDRWRQARGGIERLDVELDGGRIRCWATGLGEGRPLLLVLGGIVSIKEQWAPVLLAARRLGLAGVVTEMPGTGENTLRYDAKSARMISAVIDAVGERADTARTTALAMSFSGHLALRAALDDRRITGIVTVGAPVAEFFTDADWHRRLPRVTRDTLAHLTRAAPGELFDALRDWALTAEQLAALDIPVCYLASGRDEIIPPGDPALLRTHVRDLRLAEQDDVHAAPGHVLETKLWITSSVVRSTGGKPIPGILLGTLLGALRLRRRLSRSLRSET
jgi:hypothetical protein